MKRQSDKIMWRQLLAVRPGDTRPLQSQIRTNVVDAILSGTLKAGTTMPSSRKLAQELAVSRNTVILSYQQLVDDGFLVSRERSGFAVAERSASQWASTAARQPGPPAPLPDWSGRIRSHASDFRNIEKPADWQSYAYPFLYGQFDQSVFPIAEWRQCCRQALSLLELKDWGQDKIDADDPMLIEQLRTRILPRRGIWAEPAEILVTLGAQQALFLIAAALFDAETSVGVEEPGYPDMRNIARLRTRRIRPLAVDGAGMLPGPAVAACDYVHVTPSHQCPTGATMPLDRRLGLLAAGGGTIFIEDDYDSETSFAQAPQPALKSLDAAGRVIYVGSLSKLLAPGLRLGFIVAEAGLIRELRALRRLMVRHPPVNNQRSVALFLSFGHYEVLVRRLTDAYRRRAAGLIDALDHHLPTVEYVAPTGGSSVWVHGPPGLDAGAMSERARAHGLLLEPGDVFFEDSAKGRRHFRLGYSVIPEARIAPGIALLAEVMARMAEPQALG